MRPEDVPGRIPMGTGVLLRELAGTVPPGQCIVEIGAYRGRSTCFLASGARPGVSVISIDAHGLPGSQRGRGDMYVDAREEYLRNVGAYPSVRPVHALSSTAPLPDEPIGLLWIDGDHSYPAVSGDVRRFGGRVAPGGFVVLDDCNERNRGVQRVVREMRRDPSWSGWSFSPAPLAWARRAAA